MRFLASLLGITDFICAREEHKKGVWHLCKIIQYFDVSFEMTNYHKQNSEDEKAQNTEVL